MAGPGAPSQPPAIYALPWLLSPVLEEGLRSGVGKGMGGRGQGEGASGEGADPLKEGEERKGM